MTRSVSSSRVIPALRKATDVTIRFDSRVIELTPHIRVKSPGGAIDWEPQPIRPPQSFSVAPVVATISGISGTGGGAVVSEGAVIHSWDYTLTGRYNCEMEIGDTWEDGETLYRVVAIQPTNDYERVGVVKATGKDPNYGV
jgi:hypothetical protein